MRTVFPRILPAALAFALFPALLPAQSGFSSLEERMPEQQFKAAGLDKLSPTELKNLNDWLEAHAIQAPAGVSSSGQSAAFYPNEKARDTIEARLSEPFYGWTGKTVFTLDNGQQWQQTESGRRIEGRMDNAVVTIKPMSFGSWLMAVEGCGCSVRVKRIR